MRLSYAALIEVPKALEEQLAIGGRLVLSIGEETHQKLLKVTRKSEADFEQEDLGGVRFVPLIGEQGWAEDGRQAPGASSANGTERSAKDNA